MEAVLRAESFDVGDDWVADKSKEQEDAVSGAVSRVLSWLVWLIFLPFQPLRAMRPVVHGVVMKWEALIASSPLLQWYSSAPCVFFLFLGRLRLIYNLFILLFTIQE